MMVLSPFDNVSINYLQSKESNNQVSEWSFTINNFRVQLWDINGELKNRQIWPKYYKKVNVLVRGVLSRTYIDSTTIPEP